MKIDYKLAEKIGATHYFEMSNGDGYTLIDSSTIKPIPPKPQVHVEYEKVTESIFDLKDDLDRGELYFDIGTSFNALESQKCFEYALIDNESVLASNFSTLNVYRRIENPIDWAAEVDEYFLKTKQLGIDCTIEEAITRSDYRGEFLEMCRVALRANGEL